MRDDFRYDNGVRSGIENPGRMTIAFYRRRAGASLTGGLTKLPRLGTIASTYERRMKSSGATKSCVGLQGWKQSLHLEVRVK